jgi:hypothetical protein
VREPVVVVIVVGEINRRHGLASAAAPGVDLCVADGIGDGIVRIVVNVVAGEDWEAGCDEGMIA